MIVGVTGEIGENGIKYILAYFCIDLMEEYTKLVALVAFEKVHWEAEEGGEKESSPCRA